MGLMVQQNIPLPGLKGFSPIQTSSGYSVTGTLCQEEHAEEKELMASIRYSRNSIRQNNTNNILARMHKCDGHRIDDMVEKT